MPSGVSQGTPPAGAATVASAKAILEKSGIRVIGSAAASTSVSLKNIVSRTQCRQGVASFMNEGLNASLPQRGFLRAGLSAKIDVARAILFDGCDCRRQFRF